MHSIRTQTGSRRTDKGTSADSKQEADEVQMATMENLTFDLYVEIWWFVQYGEVLVAATNEDGEETQYDEWGNVEHASVFYSLTLAGRQWTRALIHTGFFRWLRIMLWGPGYTLALHREVPVRTVDFFEEDGRVHWPLMFREWHEYREELEEREADL